MFFVRVIVIATYINIEEYIFYHSLSNAIIIVIINVSNSQNFDVYELYSILICTHDYNI